jgi:hypothetical protein
MALHERDQLLDQNFQHTQQASHSNFANSQHALHLQSQNDSLKYEITNLNTLIASLQNKFYEIQKLYELTNRETILLKDQLCSTRVKYEQEISDGNMMVRKLQALLDDQSKTVRIYEQNFTSRQFQAHQDYRETFDKNKDLSCMLNDRTNREKDLIDDCNRKDREIGQLKVFF